MDFYLLDRAPRKDKKIPLGTTKEHRGHRVINCQACGTRGLLTIKNEGPIPVEILVKAVANLQDIEQASTVLLASNKFRKVVSDAKLTGINFYPPIGYKARINNPSYDDMIRQCRELMDFQVILVTGNGGSTACLSKLTQLKSCEICGWQEWTLPANGFKINEKEWDGSDFFYVKEFGAFFMTERAVNVLAETDLSNFGAKPASNYRSPFE